MQTYSSRSSALRCGWVHIACLDLGRLSSVRSRCSSRGRFGWWFMRDVPRDRAHSCHIATPSPAKRLTRRCSQRLAEKKITKVKLESKKCLSELAAASGR